MTPVVTCPVSRLSSAITSAVIINEGKCAMENLEGGGVCVKDEGAVQWITQMKM